MNDRQRATNQAFDAYSRIRRQAARDVVGKWVSLSLQAGGMAPLTRDEERIVEAAADCGWTLPYRVEQSEPATADDFDSLPDRATVNTAKAAPADQPGRCTLWD